MNADPTRLVDDPEFAAETGIRMEDFDAALEAHDLVAMEAAIVANAAAPPPAISSWLAALGIGAGSVVAVLMALAWVVAPVAPLETQSLPDLRPSQPPVAETVAVTPPLEAVVAPLQTDSPRPAPEVVGETVADPASSASDEPVEKAAPVPADVEDDAPAPTLGVELARYRVAVDAWEDGRHEAALQGYTEYLEAYPGGVLVAEARLGTLRTLASLARPLEVERLAAELLNDPELAPKAVEIALMRAQALVVLDRCDEALLLSDSISRADATSIRKECRRRSP